MLSAAEAEAWGLVNRVVADDALAAEAQVLAAQLSAGPTQAISQPSGYSIAHGQHH